MPPFESTMDPERRQALLWAKQAALVRDQWGPAQRFANRFGHGVGDAEPSS